LSAPLLASGTGVNASCADPGFIVPDRYAVSSFPFAIEKADFNNDTLTDLVLLSNDVSGHISVLLGKPDGTFQDAINTDTPEQVGFFQVGDFNNDGKADLVAASGYARILLFPGKGDGTFDPPIEVTHTEFVTLMVSADADGDGKPDLIVFDGTYAYIQIYLGNGDGTFQPPITLNDTASSIAVAKIDSDDHPDLILTGSASLGVTIYHGHGDGTFGEPTTIQPGIQLLEVHAADVNGDGKLDLVAVAGFSVDSFLGHGDGTFDDGVPSSAGDSPWRLSFADFNGDGILDVAVANFDYIGFGYPPYLLILLGVGDGTFLPSPKPTYVTGRGPMPLVTADFGNDGLQDIALISETDPVAFVFRGNGDGTFEGIRLFSGGQFSTTQVVVADFDSDGQPDIAQLLLFGGTSDVFVSLLDANLRTRSIQELILPNFARGFAMADVDQDGLLDLVVVASDHQLQTLLGAADGTFANPIPSPGPAGDMFAAVAAGDINGDGFPDLVIATQNLSQTFGAIELELGNGDGTFTPAGTIPLFVPPTSLILTNLDGDANLDIAAVGGRNGESGHLFILRGVGNGTFNASGDYLLNDRPVSVVSADFVEDGIPDLAVLDGQLELTVTVFQGYSDAFFAPVSVTPLPVFAAALVAGNFGADTHADLTTGSVLLTGHGDGTFAEPISYGTVTIPHSIVTADMDRNGSLDAVVVDYSNGVAFLLNAHLSVQVRTATPSVIVGSPFSITASAAGGGPLSYQWRKNGVPLSDGGPISGSTTATLTIDPVAFTDAGSYDVVVTDSCTNATSDAATLSVEFDDVPLSNPFHDDIIKIATAGITAGCNTGTSYCPSASVSRAEMAVFLLKAKFGADHVPPPPPPVPIFADVPADAFAAAWIDELSTLGITGGCGNGNYCPDDPVTRGQMAVLLLKTLLGSGYVPPTATGIFADVPPGYFAIDWIEDLYGRGITAGCGTNPLRYCPDQAVPREQMATFLVRTFSIP
jgi:hypothetical protein